MLTRKNYERCYPYIAMYACSLLPDASGFFGTGRNLVASGKQSGRIVPVTLPAHLLMNIKFGLCGDYANLAMFAMRAAGIPAGIEIVPFWGRGNGRHTF